MVTLEKLYGDVRNLTRFRHPVYKRTFRFLTDAEVVRYARKLADHIRASGIHRIVVSETGASPLARVCERLLARSGYATRWLYVKFPREQVADIFPILNSYLTKRERETRLTKLKGLCAASSPSALRPRKQPLSKLLRTITRGELRDTQKRLASVLAHTKIAKFLSEPFLYFDEYVDSGTTLANADMYFGMFAGRHHFKLLSYYIHIRDANAYAVVAHTLFDADSRYDCFAAGAYPFENRLDLIGYFYHLDARMFRRVTLHELRETYGSRRPSATAERFVDDLQKSLVTGGLVERVRSRCTLRPVRSYIDASQVVRYALWHFENAHSGWSASSEFLWLMWDMYGPIWSPLPDAYHRDFWKGFKGLDADIKRLPEYARLSKGYAAQRRAILSSALRSCDERQRDWLKNINALLQRHI